MLNDITVLFVYVSKLITTYDGCYVIVTLKSFYEICDTPLNKLLSDVGKNLVERIRKKK